jgi:hypothetical protein
MTIFISVASYRDVELVPTIQDCLAKAQWPSQLRFGVCWQHGSEESLLSLQAYPHIRILDVDWRRSRGVGWARAEIMNLYNGEDYYLQIDSHHQFAQDWDSKLIQYMDLAAVPKPIITTYCPMYTPGDALPRSTEPTQMSFHYFTADGIPMFRPVAIANWMTTKRLLRARFISAHFLFTLGSFVDEVKYDPAIYFQGEEIALTVRAYSWGYDFFHPPRVVLWHAYSREHRPKHWEDHVESGDIELTWRHQDRASRDRVRRLLLDPSIGPLACGPVRTVAEYEAYAGISFRHRKVHDYTLAGAEPPNPTMDANWHTSIRRWCGKIEIELGQLSTHALVGAQYWFISVYDSIGIELHRMDLHREVLDIVTANNCDSITLKFEFESGRAPASWTVLPFSNTEGWLGEIGGILQYTEIHLISESQ